MSDLTICHSPTQWRALPAGQLHASACVVIDVIRATSTIVTALAHGAGVQAVASLEEAFALKAKYPGAVLAGERGGQAVPGFDLGNSPEDFTSERVQGRRVILTTTNGTQALAACEGGAGRDHGESAESRGSRGAVARTGITLDRRVRRLQWRIRRG